MARSLVERLREFAANDERRAEECYGTHDEPMHRGSFYAYADAANIAKPYEDRRLALEKVAELAAQAIYFPLCPRGDDELIALRDARRALAQALAAVPEIPEES